MLCKFGLVSCKLGLVLCKLALLVVVCKFGLVVCKLGLVVCKLGYRNCNVYAWHRSSTGRSEHPAASEEREYIKQTVWRGMGMIRCCVVWAHCVAVYV